MSNQFAKARCSKPLAVIGLETAGLNPAQDRIVTRCRAAGIRHLQPCIGTSAACSSGPMSWGSDEERANKQPYRALS